ncbi:type II toxin-antitoxin system VapC family toxin [Pontibacter sp. G13]|uniref:type II toxin-antitoxin system VapC family toxin n=1 Tax=Pontibacter sp. G13 TaxID=3074898 RepID=UPI00288A4E1A|nr:type II toxin-antitoxin system VapC family toxin [Pontibacter sp. G13]WNJ21522.1 type II toxin-antitoxin system VapC family toxin [Pontibacter sp. G13]
MDRVFLDTSFFVRLLDSTDEYHHFAKTYFTKFIQDDVEVITSTIVLAEFGVKESIHFLPLDVLKILSFDYRHAEVCALFAKSAYEAKRKGAIDLKHRVLIPNDTKLFAQAEVQQATIFLGRDDGAKKVMEFLLSESLMSCQYVDLRTPPNEFFGELF